MAACVYKFTKVQAWGVWKGPRYAACTDQQSFGKREVIYAPHLQCLCIFYDLRVVRGHSSITNHQCMVISAWSEGIHPSQPISAWSSVHGWKALVSYNPSVHGHGHQCMVSRHSSVAMPHDLSGGEWQSFSHSCSGHWSVELYTSLFKVDTCTDRKGKTVPAQTGICIADEQHLSR
eukprot:203316-Pelagomonas_calceolata.AAC.2